LEKAEKLRNELEKKNESLHVEKEQLELSLQQAQNQAKTSKELQNELAEKEKVVGELQKKLITAQNEAEKLKQEIIALKNQIVNDPEKEMLKEQLDEKQKQLADAEENITAFEEKRNNLDEEISLLQEALVNKNKEESSKITELKNQLTDLTDLLVGKMIEYSELVHEESENLQDLIPRITNEEEEERIVLTSTNLTEVDYIDFKTTLKDKTSKKEMDDFGYKVIKDIYEQREKHERIIEVLSKGENALKNKNIKNAEEVLLYLELLEKLPGQKQVFSSNKRIEISRMKNRINSLINQQAQIVQNTK